MPKPFGVMLTFSFFLITAVYFRSASLSDGHRIILGATGLANGNGCWELVGSDLSLAIGGYEKSTWIEGVWNSNVIVVAGLIFWSIMDHAMRLNSYERLILKHQAIRPFDCFLVSGAILLILIFNNDVVKSPFIYFDF